MELVEYKVDDDADDDAGGGGAVPASTTDKKNFTQQRRHIKNQALMPLLHLEALQAFGKKKNTKRTAEG